MPVMLTFLGFFHYVYIISTYVHLGLVNTLVNTRKKENLARERCWTTGVSSESSLSVKPGTPCKIKIYWRRRKQLDCQGL